MKKLFYILIAAFLAGCGASTGTAQAPVMESSVSSKAYRAKAANQIDAPGGTPGKTDVSGEAPQRMKSYKYNLDLWVADKDEARRTVLSSAKDFGGYMHSESDDYVVVFVLADKTGEYLESLKNIGKVKNLKTDGADIQDSYDDIRAELETLYPVRDRYKELLKKAVKVEDMLAIEKELERVNVRIQKLENQKQQTEQRAKFSRVSIRLKKPSFVERNPWIWPPYGLMVLFGTID